jgi:hypothetical protein
MRWTKLTNIVEFPTGIGELDLTPYAADSMDKNEPKPIYSLYAVSETVNMSIITLFSLISHVIFFRFQIIWVSLLDSLIFHLTFLHLTQTTNQKREKKKNSRSYFFSYESHTSQDTIHIE